MDRLELIYVVFFKNATHIFFEPGTIGNNLINCYAARENYAKLIATFVGKQCKNVNIRRPDKVNSLVKNNTTTSTGDKEIDIYLVHLFQRMNICIENAEDVDRLFSFEISLYPLSIFDRYSMRKTTKYKSY